MKDFAHRHLQIDFHTSGDIEGIGKSFNKTEFEHALRSANIQSVNIFAKCHHSWCYFPTKVGKMHPHLDFDLCGEMIDAVKNAGAKAVVYFPVGWSEGDADSHPEWCARTKDGSISNCSCDGIYEKAKDDDFKPFYLWKHLCVNGDYAEYVFALEREILTRYRNIDGLFVDINFRYPCYCEKCKKDMLAAGVDVDNDKEVIEFYDKVWNRFVEKCKQILFEFNKDASIFFNGGTDMNKPKWHKIHTHIEMEDLPTAWGGYDKMPISAKYFKNLNPNVLGMTAVFHKAWGEFGGYKTKDALKYEIASMLSFGACSSIGIHMHPDCHTDKRAFDMIKYAYDYSRLLEEYCLDATETARVGIALTFDKDIDEGVSKILLEKQIDFDVLNDFENLREKFDLIILPDDYRLSPQKAAKINAYLKDGGKLLLSGDSGLDENGDKFLLDPDIRFVGRTGTDIGYIRKSHGTEAECEPYIVYDNLNIVSSETARITAVSAPALFKRTYKHFCGHLVVPYGQDGFVYPAVLEFGNVTYLNAKFFKLYMQHGSQNYKDLVADCINKLLPDKVLKIDVMSAGRIHLTKQAKKNRYVLNVLYASPILRGGYQVLEDFPKIRDTEVELRIKEKINRIYTVPGSESLPFRYDNGKLSFVIPEFSMHQLIVLEY